MKSLAQDFQLVIMDSPYEIVEQSVLVDHLFMQMMSLKKQGYEKHYQHGVLPVDTSDFVATHVLLCRRKRDQSLQPIMGYKTITLDRCQEFNLRFPGLSLVQNAQMPEHTKVVEDIMQRCEKEQKKLAYLGSWTVDPEYRKRPGPHEDLREAFKAFYRLLYREQNVAEVLIGGTLRFKTEKVFAELGHKALSQNGQELSHIHVAHLNKEPVLVMHSQEFNDSSKLAEQKWQDVWQERIHLEKELLQARQKRAA